MPGEEAMVDSQGTFASTNPQTGGRRLALPEAPWLWLVILFILNLALPFVPVPNLTLAIVGTIVLTILYVIIVVQFAAQVTRLQLPLGKLMPLFIASLALWAVLEWVVQPTVIKPLATAYHHTHVHATGLQRFPLTLTEAFTGLALLCTAVLGGSLISRIITTPNMLGPVCAIIAMIDVWGVLLGGIVSKLMSKAPQAVSHGMVKGPAAGIATASHYSIAVPDIGVGDYLFLGLLFAVLHAHEMNWRDAIKWTVPLMALALLAIEFPFLGVQALPGLLFIGLGVAIPNLKHFQYTREEKFALLYAGIFVVILTGALYVGMSKIVFEQDMKHKTVKTRQAAYTENGVTSMLRLNRSLNL
ncbi:MAG: hypothetical protein JO316_15760 [Abitibacteriaceae bacterium]|nr:hypothetical protein [Abditibacteriaceae bacterium]